MDHGRSFHSSFSNFPQQLSLKSRLNTTCYVNILEKPMATHSSTLAWKIPWKEEPGRLQSMESQRVGHDWATSLSLFTFMHWRRKWQPTPEFLSGESQGRWSLVGRTHLKRLSSSSMLILGLPRWDASVVKNLHAMQEMQETLVPCLSLKTPWRRKWQPMSLRVGHDWAASLSLSCIGEGNGNPLQCSCLENPREEGAWWAAVYGVAQSQTWLKRFSSSQYSCLENCMDKGAWRAIVHGVTKSQTRLSDWTCMHVY